MNLAEFCNFGELYRAALAETDEKKKAWLLREVERIIRSTQSELPQDNSCEPRAA